MRFEPLHAALLHKSASNYHASTSTEGNPFRVMNTAERLFRSPTDSKIPTIESRAEQCWVCPLPLN